MYIFNYIKRPWTYNTISYLLFQLYLRSNKMSKVQYTEMLIKVYSVTYSNSLYNIKSALN